MFANAKMLIKNSVTFSYLRVLEFQNDYTALLCSLWLKIWLIMCKLPPFFIWLYTMTHLSTPYIPTFLKKITFANNYDSSWINTTSYDYSFSWPIMILIIIIVDNGQNTEESSRDLRKLTVTQTKKNIHKLKVM